MSDKTLQERLRNSVQFWHGHCDLTMEAADRIAALEAENAKLRRLNPNLTGYANGYADAMEDAPDPVFSDEDTKVIFGMMKAEQSKLKEQRDELAAALQKVADADFDLSLHKQHDTLSYLKHTAQKALAKLDGDA